MNKPNAFNEATPGIVPAVLDTEAMIRLLLDSVPDYAIILLDAQGRVRTWPKAAERIFGWKEEEILGESISHFYPEEDLRRGLADLELEVAAREGRFEDEGWRRRKGGETFWANVVVVPLRGPAGEVQGFGKITRDLTERKRTEEKIRSQAQEILEMAAVPVVQVWEGMVLVPLIGTLDSARTQQLMERLLQAVVETASPMAVIDITGVPTVDTQTAQHLIETVNATRLLGADVIMTGIRPAIAQTLVHLGVDLSGIDTRASLASGLKTALERLGFQVIGRPPGP